METDYSNIEIKAGGLNHFSILVDVKYKDSQKDGYPVIRKKFKDYYSKLINEHEGFSSDPGAERGLFFELYKMYGYLPITTDSHLGEYIQWAHCVVDQEAINDFYNNYKKKCLSFYDNVSYSTFFDKKNNEMNERIIPIIEAIIEDSNVEEEAVNVPNKIFGTLLNNQAGTIELTTDAVLNKSKQSAYLALLADPVVDNSIEAQKLLDAMIDHQDKYLGYLK